MTPASETANAPRREAASSMPPATGTGSSPNEDDFAPTASGPDRTAEGCGEPTQGDGRLPQAGQHGSDSKQGKNQMATDLRISAPLARLPSTAIHWHLPLCGRPDAWDTGQLTAVQYLTREAAPPAPCRRRRAGVRAAGCGADGALPYPTRPTPHRIQPKQRSPRCPPSLTHLSLSTGQTSNPRPAITDEGDDALGDLADQGRVRFHAAA